MSDPPPYSEADAGPDRRSIAGTPRWVKVFSVIAVVLALLVGVLLLTGGGNHVPGRHSGSGDAGGQASPSEVPEPGDAGGIHRRRAATHRDDHQPLAA